MKIGRVIMETASLSRKPAGAHHHGNLRAALLAAAREIIAESGVEGLSLREAARRAGVSHAAPSHHFGNLAGLLAALAVEGFELLGSEMDRQIEMAGGQFSPAKRLDAVGLGYVAFAAKHPEHFRIMFRGKFKLEGREGQTVNEAANAVSQRLANALREAYAEANGKELLPEQLRARAALAQSSVHGYAALALDGAWSRPDAPQAAELLDYLTPALLQP
jgi:AcrR family transcriptional regulator